MDILQGIKQIHIHSQEAFTVADRFGLELQRPLSAEDTARLLAAVFLIDFVHFEERD